MPGPLRLADGVVFTCQRCGDCCRGDWLLHARFARIFELSPVLTLLADRAYRERGFVPRAVLEARP